ncbi:hypothetical protein MLD38_030733 [Melastoma candidum]|uniref:Uncharacterized protein n=1 Tax=Melastoma candidum TaxID=119954 RepID=A0ACB9MR45_9MYRT|nr:hypothetical protein MLD38_030733 [Melastoma candidum]
MRPLIRPHPLLRSSLLRRRYATKYTAKITSSSPGGRSLSAEIISPSPPSPPTDPRGYSLPRHDLICKATNLLLSGVPNPLHHLSDYLHSVSATLTPTEASLVLKSLTCPRLSLVFFHRCPSLSPGKFRHTPATYTRIILILSKSTLPDRLEQVYSILNLMDRHGVHGSVSTLNLLIGMAGEKDLDKCMELGKKWGIRTNGYTYKCLVQACLRSHNVVKAHQMFVEMRRKGYRLDVFGYNMLLDALAKDGKVGEARKVFDDMKRNWCEPDQFSYTIMIRMTGKMGKSDEAFALFQEMIGRGHSPNLIAYNTTIEALAAARLVDKSLHMFYKMLDGGCRPNEFTYSVILNLLISEGQLGRLDEVLEMSKKHVSKSIYAYLVRTLSKFGHASEAHRLFCNMWKYHDEGDRDAFIPVLESFCDSGKLTEAVEFLDNIHEKGVTTNTLMYNMVLSALGKSKRVSELHNLYCSMKLKGTAPDIFTYNIMISSFGRAGEIHEAIKVFEELERSDCKPDIISYNTMINCLGKTGHLDEAHIRFMEMRERGLNPDVFTYSTLIECFGKTDKVDMAIHLFEQMIKEGCSPNIVTYNILLDCLERSGRTAEAVELYARLKQQGLTPDYITYSILERLQSGSHRKVRVRRKHPITGWVVSPLG